MPPRRTQKKDNAVFIISRRELSILFAISVICFFLLWNQFTRASRYMFPERIEVISSNNEEWPPTVQIKAITDSANTIILIAINFDNVDFAANLITSIQSFGVKSFVLLPLDSKAHAVLLQYYPNNTVPQFPGLKNVEASDASYGSKNFKSIVQARPRIILSFLETGVYVLYNDSDMVWKSNILEDMKSKLNASGVLLDAVIADDDRKRGSCKRSVKLCTCNMLFAPTDSSKQLMKRWEQRMNRPGEENRNRTRKERNRIAREMVNQFAFNEVLLKMRKEQSIKYSCVGESEGYPSGMLYFNRSNNARRAKAKVVHNNWMHGKPKKLKRFQDYGLWNPGAMSQTEFTHSA